MRACFSAIDRNALKGQDRLGYEIFDWALADDATEFSPDRRALPASADQPVQRRPISFAAKCSSAVRRSPGPARRQRHPANSFTRWLDQPSPTCARFEAGRTHLAHVERMIAQVDVLPGIRLQHFHEARGQRFRQDRAKRSRASG
jgi:hypothetical protein